MNAVGSISIEVHVQMLMVGKEETILLDPPGQPELTTHHTALPRILHRLEKAGHRVPSPFSDSF